VSASSISPARPSIGRVTMPGAASRGANASPTPATSKAGPRRARATRAGGAVPPARRACRTVRKPTITAAARTPTRAARPRIDAGNVRGKRAYRTTTPVTQAVESATPRRNVRAPDTWRVLAERLRVHQRRSLGPQGLEPAALLAGL